MHSLLTLNFAFTNYFEFEEMDTKNHPQIGPIFRHGRRHARIYICHYLITIILVLNMVKAAKKPLYSIMTDYGRLILDAVRDAIQN